VADRLAAVRVANEPHLFAGGVVRQVT
jgi:hypothetical protein